MASIEVGDRLEGGEDPKVTGIQPKKTQRARSDEAAGLRDVTLYALEGPASKLLADPALEMSDPVRRDGLMTALRLVERDPALLGMSAHLLGVGWR